MLQYRSLVVIGPGNGGEYADGLAVVVPLIVNDEGFDKFRRPGNEVPVWQCRKHLGAFECKLRLADDSEHILVIQEVDTGLSSDCGIHLSQKCGRQTGKADSPLVDGCVETGHVGSDASADGENQGLAVGLQVQKPSAYLQDGVDILGIFIGIDGETAPEIAARLQRFRNPVGIGLHVPVRQDVDGRIILQIRDGILNCPPGVYCA